MAARKARESVQRKSPMSGGGLPGKLSDCSDKDAANCELFIVRVTLQAVLPNKDAAVSIKPYLPIRGKIFNVERVHVAQSL